MVGARRSIGKRRRHGEDNRAKESDPLVLNQVSDERISAECVEAEYQQKKQIIGIIHWKHSVKNKQKKRMGKYVGLVGQG